MCTEIFIPFSNYFTGLRIITLNINGLNNKMKQLHLIEFIKQNKLDVIMLQEHNIRDRNILCKELLDAFHVFINLSVNQKGGAAIIFNKKLNINYISDEMSADSRIVSVKIKLYNTLLHFVNIYAPSGS